MFAVYGCLECGARRVYGCGAPEPGQDEPVLIRCRKQGVNTMHAFAWLVEHWNGAPRPLDAQRDKDLVGFRHRVEYDRSHKLLGQFGLGAGK